MSIDHEKLHAMGAYRLFQLERAFGLFKIEADNEQGWFILGFELPRCSLVCLYIVTDGSTQGRTCSGCGTPVTEEVSGGDLSTIAGR
jgi:hypothetical protein